jgi:hypothetical protein
MRDEISTHHSIPAWFPREQLGVPFWSNPQNCSFLPTHLLLLLFDPADAYTVVVYVSVLISALFSYLYARSVDMSRVASAAAAWTFACSGYFASRLLAGHLGLVETYAALPMLLWCIESVCTRSKGRHAARMAMVLAILCGIVSLGAHPQLPIYALVAALVYALGRCSRDRIALVLGSIVLGVGLAGFALVPLARLVARSSRALILDRADNDIALPYQRLAAMLFPWRDGVAGIDPPNGVGEFSGYPNAAYFWDTINYVGWLPLLAVAAFALMVVIRRRAPRRSSVLLVVLSAAAFLTALPLIRSMMSDTGPMMLRSPARLMYIVCFGLSIAFGRFVDSARALGAKRHVLLPLPFVLLAVQGADLYSFDRHFVQPWDLARDSRGLAALIDVERDGKRVAVDADLDLKRTWDDVGFMDAISLKATYVSLLALARLPELTSIEGLDGWQMNARGLRACGVRLLLTTHDWPFAKPVDRMGALRVYELTDVPARVESFADADVRYVSPSQVNDVLRDESVDLSATLFVSDSGRTTDAGPPTAPLSPARDRRPVIYRQPSPDRFEITTQSPSATWIRVLESYDIGWSAKIDGAPAAIQCANGMVMAVHVPAGRHELAIEFTTPGWRTGLLLTMLAAGALLLLAIRASQQEIQHD